MVDPESVQSQLFQKRHDELVSILQEYEKHPKYKQADCSDDEKNVRAKVAFLDKLLRHSYIYHSGPWTQAQAEAEAAALKP